MNVETAMFPDIAKPTLSSSVMRPERCKTVKKNGGNELRIPPPSEYSGCSVGTRAGSLDRAQVACDFPVRIFMVLENRLLREAMARIFRKLSDLLVVGSDRKESCCPQKILESQCNVVVLDFLDLDWVKLTRDPENAGHAQPRLLLVGMDGEFEQFLAAVRAGVTSYLLKDASREEVISAVRSTSRGLAICPPALFATLLQYVFSTANRRPAQDLAGRPLLTLRQQRLTALIAKGWTNKEIASHLNLSEYTVRNHVHRIMKQVDAASRSQAVERILSHGYALTA